MLWSIVLRLQPVPQLSITSIPSEVEVFLISLEGFQSTALLFRERRGASSVLGNMSAFLLSNEDVRSGMSLVCFTVAKYARGIAADRLIWSPPKLLPVLRVSRTCADRCICRCNARRGKTERREAEKVISRCGNMHSGEVG